MFTHGGVRSRWSSSVLVTAIGAVGLVTASGGCFAGGFGFFSPECTALASQSIQMELEQELNPGVDNDCAGARLQRQFIDAGCVSSSLSGANSVLESLGVSSPTESPEDAEAWYRELALEAIEEHCE